MNVDPPGRSQMRATSTSQLFLFMVTLVVVLSFGSAANAATYSSSFGSKGTGNGQFELPSDVEVDSSTGDLWVADHGNHRIQRLSSKGEYISQFGSQGSGNGQFEKPRSIAVDSEGNLWVADSGNHRIQKFNSKGEYLLKCGSKGPGNGQFSSHGPKGIAIDASDNVWVTDYSSRAQKFNSSCEFLKSVSGFGESSGIDVGGGEVWVSDWSKDKVKVFDEAGEPLFEFGASGSGKGQFNGADGVEIDNKGRAWVLETDNDRVQQFNQAGEYQSHFGTSGSGEGQFSFAWPVNLTSDSKGAIWIADNGNHRVQRWLVWTLDPTYSSSFGSNGSGNGQFNLPSDVEVDTNTGDLWVADLDNHRIQRLNIKGEFLSQFGSEGTSSGQFQAPRSVAIDSKGNIWVTDSGNHRIQKFDSKGEFLLKCGSQGSGNGQFWTYGPKGIAVDASDNVWVTDYSSRAQKFNSSCEFLRSVSGFKESAGIDVGKGKVWISDYTKDNVKVFDEAGEALFEFGSSGSAKGQLDGPDGVEIDGVGNVWVLEVKNDRVQQFNQAGEYQSHFGTNGTGEGQFALSWPINLTSDDKGALWIADNGNHRVQKWLIPLEAPENLEAPRITVSFPQETIDLRSEPGKWIGGEPLTFTYQWRRCNSLGASCENINGATSETYAPTVADLEKRLRVTVGAENTAGFAEAESSATQPVDQAAPRWVEPVEIDGLAKQGETLEADLAGLRGSPPLNISYEWERCDEFCAPISEAEASSYQLTSNDVATQIILSVQAENELGLATNRSMPTDPIEPAAWTGKPNIAARPRLAGEFRVTGTLGTTFGAWAGSEPIEKTIQWERCDALLAECVSIEGADEQAYDVKAEDEGMRLRARVTAENLEGSDSSASIASPPVLPAVNTVFTAKEPLLLGDAMEVIDEAEVSLISVSYGGEFSGILSGHTANPVELLEEYEDATGEDISEALATSFTLSGSVPTESLGEMGEGLDRSEVPTLRSSVAEEEPSESELKFADKSISQAANEARDSIENCPGPFLPCPVGAERGLITSFTWNLKPAEVDAHIEKIGSIAVEFDTKQINRGNANFGIGIGEETLQGICLPWELNNFYIGDRTFPLAIVTSLPPEAGVYWDTAFLDSCEEKDLTYGIYHPEVLEYKAKYYTQIYFLGEDAAGDNEQSEISWGIQVLGRHCDISPFCVNIPKIDPPGEPHPILKKGELFHYKDHLTDRWGPPVFPHCFFYWNEDVLTVPPELPHECVIEI